MITVTLDDYEFEHVEVPEVIPWGGDQMLVSHQLIGGARKVSTLGRNDMKLTFRGKFRGEAALNRAQYLDTLRVEGKTHAFRWDNFSYLVVIESFQANYTAYWDLPFEMTLLVVDDLTKPVNQFYPAFFNDQITAYMDQALFLSNEIQDPSIGGAIGALNATVGLFPALQGPGAALANQALGEANVGISSVQNAISALGDL